MHRYRQQDDKQLEIIMTTTKHASKHNTRRRQYCNTLVYLSPTGDRIVVRTPHTLVMLDRNPSLTMRQNISEAMDVAYRAIFAKVALYI